MVAGVLVYLISFAYTSRIAATFSEQKIELGRRLFFDRRLSVNFVKSCGTCHNPKFAFTDGYKRSIGAFADLHQRNTTPLFNMATYAFLTASDSTLHDLRKQMRNPLYSTQPVEMGVKNNEEKILQRIKNDPYYAKQLTAVLGIKIEQLKWDQIVDLIAGFVSTIQSHNSKYDKFVNGERNIFSTEEQRGLSLFNSLQCSSCHGGKNFATPTLKDELGNTEYYFNTGLYNIDGKGSYPLYDQGLYQHTHQMKDMGKFRVPTLRNLAFTGPYLHDGSEESLLKVIDIFVNGGREIDSGINAGNGKLNPYKHKMMQVYPLSEHDKRCLLSFLYTLTDSSIVENPKYSNPFTYDETENSY